jgi:hypothetical protein
MRLTGRHLTSALRNSGGSTQVGSLDQVQDLLPMGPDSRKHHPKQSVFPLQSQDSFPSLKYSQLLPLSQVLQR